MIKNFSTRINKRKWREITALCGIDKELISSYKLKPMEKATIIMENNGLSGFDAEWGLIPESTRSGNIRGTLTDARFENLLTSPSFRIPIRQKRCLIPIDSYYIWHKTANKKTPYRVLRRDGEPIYVAGLWDKWPMRYGTILSFCIITNAADESTESFGSRVPMVFDDLGSGMKWLQKADFKGAIKLLGNPSYEKMMIYRITENFDRLESEDLHKEVKEEVTLFD